MTTENRCRITTGTDAKHEATRRIRLDLQGEAVKHAKQQQYVDAFDEAELRRRFAFLELTDEDFRRLASLKSFADRWMHEITDGLYELILAEPESRAFIPDAATLARLKKTQNNYFAALFAGNYDLNYIRDRLADCWHSG